MCTKSKNGKNPRRDGRAADTPRARQKAAGRECGPDTLAEIAGADHVLSLEPVLARGEVGEAIEFQLTDSFCIAQETEVPRGVYRVDLKSISTPLVFLTTQYAGLPFVKIEGDTDIVLALQSPVSDSELDLLLDPKPPELPPPPVPVRREAAKVEGASTVGFVPGANLASGPSIEADVSFSQDSYSKLDSDQFGVVSFHLPTKTVVGAVQVQTRIDTSLRYDYRTFQQ